MPWPKMGHILSHHLQGVGYIVAAALQDAQLVQYVTFHGIKYIYLTVYIIFQSYSFMSFIKYRKASGL